ncbi:MAG: hypothetical protein U9N42_09570 [Campylobacterota bacterium]|nr:hypothetical protein [Campylobacterota bacterium]
MATPIVEISHEEHVHNRSYFIVFSVAFALSIIWLLLGDTSQKLVIATITFILFLRSAIKFEESSIATSSNKH